MEYGFPKTKKTTYTYGGGARVVEPRNIPVTTEAVEAWRGDKSSRFENEKIRELPQEAIDEPANCGRIELET